MGEFKGVWTDKSITDLGLPPAKMMVLAMIKEMQPFHASNKYIGESLNVGERSVSRIIAELQEKKLIIITGETSARTIQANMAIVDSRQYGDSTHANMADTYANLAETHAILATNNKDKKDNKEYSKVLPEYLELAELLATLHREVDPKFIAQSSHLNTWAEDIRKLVEIDKRSLQEVEEVLRWAKQPDNFWFPNVRSGKKLRKNFEAMYPQCFKFRPKKEEVVIDWDYDPTGRLAREKANAI